MSSSNRKGLTIALVAFVIIAALGFFFIMPGMEDDLIVETNDTKVVAPAAPAAQAETAAVPVAPEAPAVAAPVDSTSGASLLAPPAALKSVEEYMTDRVLGDVNAPVEIIEYASMTCSHCAEFATKVLPEVKTRLLDTGKAKLILRDFPLDQVALKAAMMARCVEPSRYYNMVEVIFTNQEKWIKNPDPLAGVAQLGALAGMDAEAFKACTSNTALETAILEGLQKAQTKYQIASTPTFVFNNGAEVFSGAQTIEKFEETVNKLTKGK